MSKRRKIFRRIFQVVNTLMIIGILGYYGYRALYYKEALANVGTGITEDERVPFHEKLRLDIVADYDHIAQNEDGSFYYFEKPAYNYVSYAGRNYRILSVDAEGNVRMVEDGIETITPLINKVYTMPQENSDEPLIVNGTLFDSWLYSWLNPVEGDLLSGIYYQSLSNPDLYLTDTRIEVSTVDSLETVLEENNYKSSKIGLLSIEDYRKAGGSGSFLNNGTSFWLSNLNIEGNYWYVNEEGDLSITTYAAQMLGVRPVITVSKDVIVTSGNGTYGYPFHIEEAVTRNLNQAMASQIVSFSDHDWTIINVNDEYAELILNDYVVDEEGNPVEVEFGENHDFSTSSGIGRYLNNTFYNSLAGKDHLLKHDWNYGYLEPDNLFDWHNAFDKTVNCYVMLPNLSNFALQGYPEIYLAHKDYTLNDLTFIIDENSYLYSGMTTTAMKIRPVICIASDAAITSGNGSVENPYVLEFSEGGQVNG